MKCGDCIWCAEHAARSVEHNVLCFVLCFVFVWGMSAVCSLGFGECTSCPSIDASSPLPPLSFYFEFFQQDFDLNCQILEFDRKQLEAPSLLWLQLLLVNQPNKQRQNTFQIINVFTAQTAWKTLKMNLTFTFSVLCIQLGKTLKLRSHFLSAVP